MGPTQERRLIGWQGPARRQLPCKFLVGEARQRIFELGSLRSLKDEDLADSEDVPEPKELANDAITKLRAALEDPSAVIAAIEHGNRDVKEDRK